MLKLNKLRIIMRDKWIICKILELNLIINQIRQLDNYKI